MFNYTLILQVLPKRHSPHLIHHLPTREISLMGINFKHRRARIYDVHPRIIIRHILQHCLPFRFVMYFIYEDMRPAMVIMKIHKVKNLIVCKPYIVERDIQHLLKFLTMETLFDMLQQQSCLATASRSLNTNKFVFPVYLIEQVSMKFSGCSRQSSIENPYNLLNP